MSLRPASPGAEIARAPHSRRARDLRGVGSPEGSGLFGRRPAARKEAGAAPAVSRCMGQQGAVARGGGLGRPPSRSARQAERARGPGSSQQAEEDICAYCGRRRDSTPVNPGGGLAGSVRLARCTVGCGAPAQADAREVAPLCVAALRACPWLSDIDRARLSDERLAARVALCGSCRERFAARRVREYVSSDVSLCTSYQS